MWIDTDSATLYMITYRIKSFLATPEDRDAAIAKLKTDFQICYQDKKCYVLDEIVTPLHPLRPFQ